MIVLRFLMIALIYLHYQSWMLYTIFRILDKLIITKIDNAVIYLQAYVYIEKGLL